MIRKTRHYNYYNFIGSVLSNTHTHYEPNFSGPRSLPSQGHTLLRKSQSLNTHTAVYIVVRKRPPLCPRDISPSESQRLLHLIVSTSSFSCYFLFSCVFFFLLSFASNLSNTYTQDFFSLVFITFKFPRPTKSRHSNSYAVYSVHSPFLMICTFIFDSLKKKGRISKVYL